MGIRDCALLAADEPGSWATTEGALMWAAVTTSLSKPGLGERMKVIVVGTLAPATSGWWHDLVADGSKGSTYVQALQGQPDRWSSWKEIKRCNPLVAVSDVFKRRLLEERDEALEDTRKKGTFLSYRLNVPSGDESTMLLDATDWELMASRGVPEPEFSTDSGPRPGGRAELVSSDGNMGIG